MRTIAVVNFKGGTGKTTTAVNLAAGLARLGQRVLLIDADPHAGLTHTFGAPPSPSLSDVLAGHLRLPRAIFPARESIHLLPGNPTLSNAARERSDYVKLKKALGSALRACADAYDLVLIDCAASLIPLTVATLALADEYIIPTQVEYLSLLGLNQVLETLARIRAPGRPPHQVDNLNVALIVPTFYDVRRRVARLLVARLRETFGPRVAPPIRTSVRFAEAPALHRTIFEHAPGSSAAFDYQRLVDYFLQVPSGSWAPIGLRNRFDPSIPLQAPPRAQPASPRPAPPAKRTTPEEIPLPSPSRPTAVPTPEAALPPPTECPYCHIPLGSIYLAGYRVLFCERCGYQKQQLLRDLRNH